MKLAFLALPLVVALAAPSASAQDSYRHGFDRAGDRLGWVSGRGCRLANPGSGGNPGGYLDIDCFNNETTGWINAYARTSSPEFTGNYAGKRWTLSMDLVQLGSERPSTIRITLGGDPLRAWTYLGDWGQSPRSVWRTHTIAIDPSWTDAEAEANGWSNRLTTSVSGEPMLSWADTLRAVGEIEVYIHSATRGQPALRVGIDNFSLREAR